MNLWLRYLIFGSGYGLPPKDHDMTWFMLSGRAYHWLGGFGAQLISYEWRQPRFGEERVLAGVLFRPLFCERRWFLYDISWRSEELAGTVPIDEAADRIRAFRKKLGAL